MSYVIVIPAINPTMAHRCIASIDPLVRERVLLVDNSIERVDTFAVGQKIVGSPKNLGVARSWNMGIEYAKEMEARWLFILSTSVIFHNGALELDAATRLGDEAGDDNYCIGAINMGWHLHGFRTEMFDITGTFDEHFYPGYYEDTDMLYRMGLAGLHSPRENDRSWPYFEAEATLFRDADAVQSKRVHIDFEYLEAYYVRKWGGKQGEEKFTTPFGLTGGNPHDDDPDASWVLAGNEPIDWKWWP